MKKQKENSHEGITWSEMGKQNVQAEKVYYPNQSQQERTARRTNQNSKKLPLTGNKAREKSRLQVEIGFAFHYFKNWCTIFKHHYSIASLLLMVIWKLLYHETGQRRLSGNQSLRLENGNAKLSKVKLLMRYLTFCIFS